MYYERKTVDLRRIPTSATDKIMVRKDEIELP